jgi:dTDP-4-amino-4,6-dideoxygalactose transaminase
MISFTSFQQEPAELRERMTEAFARVLGSGYWVLGPEVAGFEATWAARCGVAHAVGTGNGLDALEIALRVLDVGEGDEVITTPMTALATVLAITRVGATPVLADIDPETALLDLRSIERCLSPRTRALIPVHLYGNGSSATAWAEFAQRRDIVLIEDCAQAHLASLDGRPVGSFGAAAAFSFYPTKNLGAIGDAGALVTDDADLAEHARMLRNYGQRDRYHHEVAGMNSRLDELQAALLLVRLEVLEEQTERRRSIAARYHAQIVNPAVELLRQPASPEQHVHHLFVIRSKDRESLQQHLTTRGVMSLIHYPVAVHQQPPYRDILRDPAGLPVSERHASTCLSLPCHPGLTDPEVDQVIDAVNSFGVR